MHCRHRGRMGGAERRRMQELRDEQQCEPIGRPANGEKPRNAAGRARDKDGGERKTPKERRQEKKHDDFGEHAQHPEKADQRTAVTFALQMQREERVERAVRCSHAQSDAEQQHHRARQTNGARGCHDARGRHGKQRCGGERAQRTDQHRDRQCLHCMKVEPCAAGEDGGHEAGRAPQANRPITPRLARERAEGDRLYERQGGSRYQARQRHQPGEVAEVTHERQQRATDDVAAAGEDHDRALRARAVGERAPRGGRDDACELRQREHPGDLRGAETARGEVRRQVSHPQAGVNEEEEVERAQAE